MMSDPAHPTPAPAIVNAGGRSRDRDQCVDEALLRITGEDAISVERKGIADWVGRLPTRFVLMTNILPGIVDAGGAIASRFIILRFTRSFYGQEDLQLTDKLLDELPGARRDVAAQPYRARSSRRAR